jgi:rod shape-determining protein MreC
LIFYPNTLPRLLAPLKLLAQRFAYAALVLLSIAIIVIGKADVALVERIRTATSDVMTPILSVLTRPVAAGEATMARLADMTNIYGENQRLREENETLLQWQQVARRLESENQELRDLSHYQPGDAVWYISGRVIGTAGGAYSRSLLIDRGGMDGIAKGQAATSGIGLVGRIAEVGDRAARVLLLTDLNSRIPVTLQSSHERAILAGDNSARPMLAFLAPNAKPELGERVVTSGDGGVFPPGIPVGVVVSTGSQVRVATAADLAVVDYVKIVDFGLSGMLPPTAVPAPKPPRKGAADGGARP